MIWGYPYVWKHPYVFTSCLLFSTAPCWGVPLSSRPITQLPWDMPWWAPDLFEDQRREFPAAQLKLEFVKVPKGFPFMLIVKFGTEETGGKDWLIETNRTSHMLAFHAYLIPDFRTHQHYAWTGIPPISPFCTILWIWIISFMNLDLLFHYFFSYYRLWFQKDVCFLPRKLFEKWFNLTLFFCVFKVESHQKPRFLLGGSSQFVSG